MFARYGKPGVPARHLVERIKRPGKCNPIACKFPCVAETPELVKQSICQTKRPTVWGLTKAGAARLPGKNVGEAEREQRKIAPRSGVRSRRPLGAKPEAEPTGGGDREHWVASVGNGELLVVIFDV